MMENPVAERYYWKAHKVELSSLVKGRCLSLVVDIPGGKALLKGTEELLFS